MESMTQKEEMLFGRRLNLETDDYPRVYELRSGGAAKRCEVVLAVKHKNHWHNCWWAFGKRAWYCRCGRGDVAPCQHRENLARALDVAHEFFAPTKYKTRKDAVRADFRE